MNKIKIVFMMFILLANTAISQTQIDWSVLSDVEFTDVYMEEVDEYFLYPHFGPSVRNLAGQEL